MCNSTEKLHVHHIVQVVEDETKILDLNNGITLCEWCHKMTHHPKLRPELTTYNFEEKTWA